MSEAFVYKWTHLPTYKWYVGYHKGHPDDGYVCGSPTLCSIIKCNATEWKREIIAVGSKQEMFELETEILQLFDAAKDERSFNRHNNHFGISIGGWNKGLKTGPNEKISKAAKGRAPWNKGKKTGQPSPWKNKPNPFGAINGKKSADKVRVVMNTLALQLLPM